MYQRCYNLESKSYVISLLKKVNRHCSISQVRLSEDYIGNGYLHTHRMYHVISEIKLSHEECFIEINFLQIKRIIN